MTEEDKIKEVLYRFEECGLVLKDVDTLLACISERILGIGIGEQGFVTSRGDVRAVLEAGRKLEEPGTHTVSYGRVEALRHAERFATVCAEVVVTPRESAGAKRIESRFQQLLTLIREDDGVWRICALHASTPVLTEENIEAYPLRFADKTLRSLRERIGEQVYQAEEQYRQAVLSDTIAFYIANFTHDIFEKCQCNGDLCARVEQGTPYEEYILDNLRRYVHAEDAERFQHAFSIENVRSAFRTGTKELACEYRLKKAEGGYLWATTTIRLIIDVETGDQKGILYVRDVDRSKQEELALLAKASFDGMTRLYNKESFIHAVDAALSGGTDAAGSVLIMCDVDDFKAVNDTFGHPVGDQVLVAVADVLREAFPGRVTGRLGGDEFCVFLPGPRVRSELEERLHILLKRFHGLRVPDAPGVRVTCSVGAAVWNGDCCFASLYKRVDHALYASKQSGKDRVSFF